MGSEHEFIRRDAEIEQVYEVIRGVAGARRFLVDRFVFEWHIYKSSAENPRDVIRAYLAHLRYDPARVDSFPEIPTDRALSFVDALWTHDFARNEDLLPPAATATCARAIREAILPWAILAFTNLLEPARPPYAPERPFGGRFIAVLQKKSAEAGIVFLGETDISFVWFDDDDSPKRSIWSYSEYRRATGRQR